MLNVIIATKKGTSRDCRKLKTVKGREKVKKSVVVNFRFLHFI